MSTDPTPDPARSATDLVPPLLGIASQAARVEHSRAIEEVRAAIVVAQQLPRSVTRCYQRMREACSTLAVAEAAFYRFPRGDQTVTGVSIHLARLLALCWTNVQYNVIETDRDDDRGVSEMLAWAWDLERNVKASTSWLVPHARDKTDKQTRRQWVEKLTTMRDVYEHNANEGSRRVRQMILAVLDPAYVAEAKDLCNKTRRDGGGMPLGQRIANILDLFSTGYGITTAQLEQRLNRGHDQWTEHDVADLKLIGRSLDMGEITIADEFPAEPVTASVIETAVATAKAAKAAKKTEAHPAAAEPWPAVPPIPDAGNAEAQS